MYFDSVGSIHENHDPIKRFLFKRKTTTLLTDLYVFKALYVLLIR